MKKEYNKSKQKKSHRNFYRILNRKKTAFSEIWSNQYKIKFSTLKEYSYFFKKSSHLIIFNGFWKFVIYSMHISTHNELKDNSFFSCIRGWDKPNFYFRCLRQIRFEIVSQSLNFFFCHITTAFHVRDYIWWKKSLQIKFNV